MIWQNGMVNTKLLAFASSHLPHTLCHEQMKSIFLIDNHGLNVLEGHVMGTRWRVIEMKFEKVLQVI